MHTITYVSTAKNLFSENELFALLEKSRDNNARFGITGMLLYRSGSFMQAIEGPKDAVTQLYSNICHDPSHYNIITLVDEPVTERNFASWHMGFAYVSDHELMKMEGFSNIFYKPAHENSLPAKASAAKQLLLTFRNSMR